MLADYATVVREKAPRADGQVHVDTPATVAKLKALHVTTYFYLVWQQASDWTDLQQEFLPAAQQAGITVWIYLVPPSEGASQPYGPDYLRWVREIAGLSTRFDNLAGWAMDDFARQSNLQTFTPAFFDQVEQIVAQINPSLRFLPITYYSDLTPELMTTYHSYLDGVIFPYSDFTADYGNVDKEIAHVTDVLRPFHKSAYLMVYGSPHSATINPMQAGYYNAVVGQGIEATRAGTIAGVVMYQTPKDPQPEVCPPDPDNQHLDLVVDWGSPTVPGQSAQASQQVTVDPDAPTHQLTFWERDSYYHRDSVLGYHVKQLLVNGQAAWHVDVASDAQEWQHVTVDLDPYLTPGATTATVRFQLYEQAGVSSFGVQFLVADLQATGLSLRDGGFNDNGWSLATSADPPLHAMETHYVCDPDRQEHVFQAVARLYGPYALQVFAAQTHRPALQTLAAAVVAGYRAHRYAGAAATADGLSRLAERFGQDRLAQQARSVADDLRDEA